MKVFNMVFIIKFLKSLTEEIQVNSFGYFLYLLFCREVCSLSGEMSDSNEALYMSGRDLLVYQPASCPRRP